MALAEHHRDLIVYRVAFEQAMRIFELSKQWPQEERYSLTDQIRRASRSVCGNIAEAWRKRRYPGHFVSKLSDADTEVAETQTWLDFARACSYLDETTHRDLWGAYQQVSAGLVRMMNDPESWCAPSTMRLRDGLSDGWDPLSDSPAYTPDTPDTPHTPHTPHTPDTPHTPHTPHTPNTPITPNTP